MDEAGGAVPVADPREKKQWLSLGLFNTQGRMGHVAQQSLIQLRRGLRQCLLSPTHAYSWSARTTLNYLGPKRPQDYPGHRRPPKLRLCLLTRGRRDPIHTYARQQRPHQPWLYQTILLEAQPEDMSRWWLLNTATDRHKHLTALETHRHITPPPPDILYIKGNSKYYVQPHHCFLTWFLIRLYH